MSASTEPERTFTKNASLFAALGDETRLSLLVQLGGGNLCSITQLAEGRPQTRQAIRKHLHVLEAVDLVKGVRRGRENLFQIEPKVVESAAQSLVAISQQWDDALSRLKSFVEE
ncbi:ArsR/SmtB family transcription factor [Aporhodopirellula aestuarii]|uniref:Helix-turn-helix domain-containing protein n=1 Tax=Aporhodopirellula aestuarii TaxID=2950107 RepID=A0ABT0U721_9BACT|nr:helix-turn-helix domain-containing protein [Aporhodopirellula aestuarii]MCM2372724.1 helix-turn-helix domain-containing protein [Aporhodopirellula aestuarii]